MRSQRLLQGRHPMAEVKSPITVTQNKDIYIGESLAGIIDQQTTPRLLLDFANVDHLSSAALGMLINANNRIKQKNGQLRLANIKPQIFEVFVITKLNKLFRILPTRPEAL